MNPIDRIESEQLRTDIPEFRPGDTVRVHVKIVEGDNSESRGTVSGRMNGSSRACRIRVGTWIALRYWRLLLRA